ncbi:MAG TPA: hypothetical protein VFP34_00960 [Microlunatus sp.]|nr:hypothetical protein [Microlunatus sp.]
MAGIVQPAIANAGALQQRLPRVVVGVRKDGPAQLVGEHIITLDPELTGDGALAILLLVVVPQELDQRSGQPDTPLTRVGLGRSVAAVDLSASRATTRRPAAITEAPRLEPRAQSVAPDLEDAGLKIDIGPPETEDLSLPHPEGQRDRPPCGVPSLAGCGQDALDLVDGVVVGRHARERLLPSARRSRLRVRCVS